MEQKFIVVEITKNWTRNLTDGTLLLSEQFERVINVNYQRGYDLRDWKISHMVNGSMITETIIAIFERKVLKTG